VIGTDSVKETQLVLYQTTTLVVIGTDSVKETQLVLYQTITG
jgi:hypothetical protein